MSAFGANAHLTAIINGWAPYYVEKVKQAILLYQKLNKEENVIPSTDDEVTETKSEKPKEDKKEEPKVEKTKENLEQKK